jgi:hypothetical protein
VRVALDVEAQLRERGGERIRVIRAAGGLGERRGAVARKAIEHEEDDVGRPLGRRFHEAPRGGVELDVFNGVAERPRGRQRDGRRKKDDDGDGRQDAVCQSDDPGLVATMDQRVDGDHDRNEEKEQAGRRIVSRDEGNHDRRGR